MTAYIRKSFPRQARSPQTTPWRRITLLATLFGAWVLALGCQGEKPVPPEVTALIKQLDSPNAKRRWQAASQLGKLGPKAEAAASALVKALDDPHWLVRGHAARALPRLQQAAVAPLHKALQSKQYSYRRDGQRAIAHAVRAMQKRLLPALIARAKRQPGSARSWSLSAITLLGQDALPVLARLLQESDNDLRASVARTYPSLGPYASAGIAALAKHIQDRESPVRQQVLRSLVEIGTKDPKIHARVQALFLLPGDVRVKIEAAKALAKWGTRAPKVVDGVLEILSSPTVLTFFHFQLLEPLGALTSQLGTSHPQHTRRAIDILIRFLQQRMAALRLKAAQALAIIGKPARLSAPTLISLLAKEPHLRPIILRALRSMLDASMLQQLVAHKAPTYRILAAQCLTQHADNPKALPLFNALCKDPSPKVRQAIITTMTKLLTGAHASPASKRRLLAQIRAMAQKDPADGVRAAALTGYFLHQGPGRGGVKKGMVPRGLPRIPPLRSSRGKAKNAHRGTARNARRPASRPAASMPTSRPTPSQPSQPKVTPRPQPRAALPQMTAAESLLWQSFSGPPAVVIAAAGALAKWHRPSAQVWQAWEQALLQAKKDNVLAALWQAYRAQKTRPKAFSEALRKALSGHVSHHAPLVRAAACEALGHDAKAASPALRAKALVRLLSILRVDVQKEVALAAARGIGTLALGWRGDTKTHQGAISARKIAQGLLAQKAIALRQRGLALIAALPRRHQRPLLGHLQKLLQRSSHQPSREAAAELLVGHAAVIDVALWAGLLYESSATLRLHGLDALARKMPAIDGAIPGLIALVWAREAKTESRAIDLLGRRHVKTAARAITDRLTARAWSTRAHAARALAQWCKDSAPIKQALQRATRDIHPKVRQAAKHALTLHK